MESSILEPEAKTQQTLSRTSSGRRSNDSNSPEFEFWMVRNPSFPQHHLLSADELFVDGVLLPLHSLPQPSNPPDSEALNPIPETSKPKPDPEPGPEPESSTQFSTSKRWRDIFKMGDKKTSTSTSTSTTTTTTTTKNQEDKEKKRERKSSTRSNSVAELNINIWPFSRSRSAGNSGGNRPKMVSGTATRKVSSAPCSRSNSAGESKSKKWPSSPVRNGVHLGRSSPVWQVRRGASCVRSSEPVVRTAEKGLKGVKKECLESRLSKSGGGGARVRVRVLNLNVPMCIGFGQNLSCRSDEQSNRSDGGIGGNLFNLRNLFSKKVY